MHNANQHANEEKPMTSPRRSLPTAAWQQYVAVLGSPDHLFEMPLIDYTTPKRVMQLTKVYKMITTYPTDFVSKPRSSRRSGMTEHEHEVLHSLILLRHTQPRPTPALDTAATRRTSGRSIKHPTGCASIPSSSPPIHPKLQFFLASGDHQQYRHPYTCQSYRRVQ